MSPSVPTILVVERDSRLDGLVKSLQQMGCLILRAADGPEAIEIVRVHSRPIHLMVAVENVNSRSLSATLLPYRPHMQILFVARMVHTESAELSSFERALVRIQEILDRLKTEKPGEHGATHQAGAQ